MMATSRNRIPSTAALVIGVASLLAASASKASVTFYTTKLAFDAAATTTLLEDFEGPGLPAFNVAVVSFAHNGVTYSGAPNVDLAGSPVNYTNWGEDIPIVSGTQISSHVLTANGDENILASFGSGYFAVGFDAYFNGRGSGTVTVYGAGAAVLGSLTFADGNDPATGLRDKGYIGFKSTDEVFGFRWDTTAGGIKNTGFDNISVARAAVGAPEPGALALVGIGLALLAVRRRTTAV